MSTNLLQQLVSAHENVYAGLMDATRELGAHQWSTRTGCPGWDVHDQLAHCIGVERAILGDDPPDPTVPEPTRLRDDIGWRIDWDVRFRRGTHGDELRCEALRTFERRKTTLAQLQADALDSQVASLLGRISLKKLLRSRIFDLVAHEEDIRRALGRERPLSGPASDVAIEQVLRGWAAILPGRLTRPMLVALKIDGRGTANLDLTNGTLCMGGDAASVDATLFLTPGQLLSLACGRSDAPHFDSLLVEGNRALASEMIGVASITP